LAIVNSAAVNIGVQVSFLYPDYILFFFFFEVLASLGGGELEIEEEIFPAPMQEMGVETP
jgi:hypothetical protein